MKDLKTLETFKKKFKSCGKKLNLVQYDEGQVATTFIDSCYKHFKNSKTHTLYTLFIFLKIFVHAFVARLNSI